jgi:hypothetical protein
MRSSLVPNPIIETFGFLVVCVIHGFVHTHKISFPIVACLVSSLVIHLNTMLINVITPPPKNFIFPDMWCSMRQLSLFLLNFMHLLPLQTQIMPIILRYLATPLSFNILTHLLLLQSSLKILPPLHPHHLLFQQSHLLLYHQLNLPNTLLPLLRDHHHRNLVHQHLLYCLHLLAR